MIPPPKGKDKSRDVEHKSLSVSQLQELVDKDINSVASIIGLEVRPWCSAVQCLLSPPLVDSLPLNLLSHYIKIPCSRDMSTDTYRVYTSATFQLEPRPPH